MTRFSFIAVLMALTCASSSVAADLNDAGVIAQKYMMAVYAQDVGTVMKYVDPDVLIRTKRDFLSNLSIVDRSVSDYYLKQFGFKSRDEVVAADPSEVYSRMIKAGPKDVSTLEEMKQAKVDVTSLERSDEDFARVRMKISFPSLNALSQDGELLMRRTSDGWKVSVDLNMKIGFVQ